MIKFLEHVIGPKILELPAHTIGTARDFKPHVTFWSWNRSRAYATYTGDLS